MGVPILQPYPWAGKLWVPPPRDTSPHPPLPGRARVLVLAPKGDLYGWSQGQFSPEAAAWPLHGHRRTETALGTNKYFM